MLRSASAAQALNTLAAVQQQQQQQAVQQQQSGHHSQNGPPSSLGPSPPGSAFGTGSGFPMVGGANTAGTAAVATTTVAAALTALLSGAIEPALVAQLLSPQVCPLLLQILQWEIKTEKFKRSPDGQPLLPQS